MKNFGSLLVVLVMFLSLTDIAIAKESKTFHPSFDCSKASTQVEKAICQDELLSSEDRNLSQAYKDLYDRVDRITKRYIKKKQREWLKARNKCAAEKLINSCISDQYSYRKAVLDEQLKRIEGDCWPARPPFKPVLITGELERSLFDAYYKIQGIPQGYYPIGNHRFLILEFCFSPFCSGIYDFDLKKKTAKKLTDAHEILEGVNTPNADTIILTKFARLKLGLAYSIYDAIIVTQGGTVSSQTLCTETYDGNEGKCGDNSLDIDIAVEVKHYKILDKPSIQFQFLLEKVSCEDGKEWKELVVYPYKDGKFGKPVVTEVK